jgi:ATP-dependent protease HslVU (ClpYQ) peptidase subunit
MKELNRDELLKVKGGEDIVEPDETDIAYGRATSYSSNY